MLECIVLPSPLQQACVGVRSVQNKDWLADVVAKVHHAKVWMHCEERFPPKDDNTLTLQDKILVLVPESVNANNQTPFDWYTKRRQGQVKTATYGSEFVAAHAATEHLQDIQSALRMFGVLLDGPTWMCGENQSAIRSSMIPHSTLSKRWNALSHHRVCEAVAAGYVLSHCIASAENPADLLTQVLTMFLRGPMWIPCYFGKEIPDGCLNRCMRGRGVSRSRTLLVYRGPCGVPRGAPMEYGYG